MPNANLIGTAAAARELNVHRSTLTRMVRDGKIKPVARGEGLTGGMFFRASEVARVKARLSSGRAA